MALDPAHKRALHDDGYLHLPGLVPRPLVDEALRAINHSLGSEGIAKEQLPTFRARTYAPELCESEPIRALFTASPLVALAESAIGAGKLCPPSTGQIALRFPSRPPVSPATPHIDGISTPLNGVAPGTLYHFTALAAVFLSEVSGPEGGNFTVWPGSHRLLAAHFREHGIAGVVNGFPQLPLAPPRPLVVRPGDALLSHYQLAHGIAPNLGPHIRYAVFFRLFHVDHNETDTRPLTDPWHHWAGMR